MSFETALLAWTALALVTTLSPGPDVLLVLSHAGRSGAKAGIGAALGIVSGGLYYIALFGFGALQLLVASPALFMIVKMAGAGYLVYLGVRMLWGAIRGTQAREERQPSRFSSPFTQGFVTNALNPKVALFYLAALPQFIGTGADAALRGTAMIAIHYAIGAVFLICLALFAGKARQFRPLQAIKRWLEGAVGVIFLGLAGKLALERS